MKGAYEALGMATQMGITQDSATRSLLMDAYNQHVAHQQMAGARRSVDKIFDPNESAAYKMPLSELVTLWQAKYGDMWVCKFDSNFWVDACSRMTALGMFEKVNGWVRLKEGV